MSRIRGKMNLAALKSVVRKMKGKDGKEIDVLIIPIKENDLFLSEKGGVYLNIIAFANDKIENFTHAIKQSFDKETREKQKADGVQTPFLGNLELINSGSSEQTQTSDVLPESTDDKGTDELPF